MIILEEEEIQQQSPHVDPCYGSSIFPLISSMRRMVLVANSFNEVVNLMQRLGVGVRLDMSASWYKQIIYCCEKQTALALFIVTVQLHPSTLNNIL